MRYKTFQKSESQVDQLAVVKEITQKYNVPIVGD